MNIDEVFKVFFRDYTTETGRGSHLEYVKTSGFRAGNKDSNPHAIEGNAMDFTLRLRGDYAPIKEYNDLFAYMMDEWPYRAGIDNTWIGEAKGNVHIHIDLGMNRPHGQSMPFFFKENHGDYLYEITRKDQI